MFDKTQEVLLDHGLLYLSKDDLQKRRELGLPAPPRSRSILSISKNMLSKLRVTLKRRHFDVVGQPIFLPARFERADYHTGPNNLFLWECTH